MVTAESLRAHVATLAADDMQGRATPSPGLDRAAEYLVGVMRGLELEPLKGAPDFRQTFECGRVGGRPSANVVAALPGADPRVAEEAVLVTAHYDHLGMRGDDRAGSADGDRIYNGANDDAAGTAGVLGVAAALAAGPRPRRTVVFVAFCGEELGMRGSKHWVSEPLVPLERTIAVVNLEMLGRPEPREPLVAWVTGAELSDLIDAFVDPDVDRVRFVPSSTIGWEEAAAFGRSDNAPFAAHGVVAHTISTGRIDELYHTVDDEPEALDYPRMARLVRAIAVGVARLADADDRPTWSERGNAAGYE